MKRFIPLWVFSTFWPTVCFGSWQTIFDHPKSWEFAPKQKYSIRAYSEFMPAPKIGLRPYELLDHKGKELTDKEKAKILSRQAFREFYDVRSPRTFFVHPYDEHREIRPGLKHLARSWMKNLVQLIASMDENKDRSGISETLRLGNPWPKNPPKNSERPIVSLTPLTLSRTQDDLGQTPWTVFGGSEKDWEWIFWRSLKRAERPERWFFKLIKTVFEKTGSAKSLRDAGLWIFSKREGEIPKSLRHLLWKDSVKPASVRFLVTFLPFGEWPGALRQKLASGDLDVIPHPATLIFHRPPMFELAASVHEEAYQIPLAREFSGYASDRGLRIPQVHFLSGIPEEKSAVKHKEAGVAPPQPPKKATAWELLFASDEGLDLYDKPIARNTQIWRMATKQDGSGFYPVQWIADGSKTEGIQAIESIATKIKGEKGTYYRNYFPPMQVNGWELRWYRPLVAWWNPTAPEGKKLGMDYDLMGVMGASGEKETVWLMPELRAEKVALQIAKMADPKGVVSGTTPLNVKKILDFAAMMPKKLSGEMASRLLTAREMETPVFAEWLWSLNGFDDVLTELRESVEVDRPTQRVRPKTFGMTKGDDFEVSYWDRLSVLTTRFRDKNNVEPAADEVTGHAKEKDNRRNDLPALVDYLDAYYQAVLGKMPDSLEIHRHGFHWEVDFEFSWWLGRFLNEPGKDLEAIKRHGHKNLIVVIPGENRAEAVLMADHMDTAFMGDVYGATGHRHAAQGADDNHSATVALMEAVPSILRAKKAGTLKLLRDIWIVHLTGEEFPADCLGARALTESLVTGAQITNRPNPKVVGVYVLDMVGHNTNRDRKDVVDDRSIFQIAPGRGEGSAYLARIAHEVTLTWNDLAGENEISGWNGEFHRKEPAKRSVEGERPPHALFPRFIGEIRPGWHFKSALYNTDGIIFSDAGIPVVLFMENYDIHRVGYHDGFDNLQNIDLDYAAGVSRIAIETVAQVASEP